MATSDMAARLRQQQEEEDASQLKLGREFSNAACLLISEVKMLLEARHRAPPDTQVYNKTVDYVKTFTRFPSTEATAAARQLMRRTLDLSQFETAQVGNLCPQTADEAKSCIPSLAKVDDEVLQPVLDELQTLRKFQT